MYGNKLSHGLIIVTCILLIGTPALAGDRFTDNGDETVTDHQLGLMWAKTDNQGDINWKEANQLSYLLARVSPKVYLTHWLACFQLISPWLSVFAHMTPNW